MSKLKNILLISFSLVSFLSVQSHSNIKVAAVVNKNIITTLDLEHRVKLLLMNAPQSPSAEELAYIRQKLLKQMIDETLQLEETNLYDIKADKEELERQIQHIEKGNNLKSGELLKKLDEAGIPHSALLNQFKAGIAWQKLVGHLAAASELSDQEIVDRAKLKQSSTSPRYLLAEIVLPASSYFETQESEAKAHEIISMLQQGHGFGQLAQQFSQNPSAIRGGDIDWVDETQIDPMLLTQIKQTPIGAITQPIQHQGAIHLILVRGKQDPTTARHKLSVRQIEIAFPLLMTASQKEEEISKLEEIMKNVKTCQAFEKAAEKIEGATLQYHQNINPEQLSGGLDKVLESLEVGHVSPPLPIQDKSVMFFMVCEKHAVNKDQDLQEKKKVIKEQLEQKKFMEHAAKRLNAIRRRAFIDVRL